MALFTGTSGADAILRTSLTPGVVVDVAGATGTDLAESNFVYGRGGDDVIEAGDFGDTIYGGAGDDVITGGAGWDWISGGSGSDTLTSGDNFGGAFVLLDGGTGADRMTGGQGQQFFVVDSYGDVVRDFGDPNDMDLFGEDDGDRFDTIVTNLDYVLAADAGVESLDFNGSYFGLADRDGLTGVGTCHANTLVGNDLSSVLYGRGGNDIVQGFGGDDRVFGGRGDDDVQGNDGADVVRGQGGNDNVWGGSGRDRLVGGRGDDTFFFNYATDSGPGQVDRIVAGDGAVAFEGAGEAGGDLIWLPNATAPDPWVPFFGPWVFGETGEGGVTCVERGGDTLVRGNIDADADFEFLLLIEDGAVRADAYTAEDFFLG